MISKNLPLVSVVIPSYNTADYLPKTTGSVLNQTYKKIEVIIVDDGSIDGTEVLLEQLADKDSRIKFIKIGHSGLPSVARNVGLKEARGSFIALLDSDDYWRPAKLEEQIKLFLKNPEIDILCTDAYRSGENNRYLNDRSSHFFSFEELSRINGVITSSVVFRSSVINELGLFNENEDLKAFEDYEFWLRCLIDGKKIYYLAKPLINYTFNPSGLSRTLSEGEDVYKKLIIFRGLLECKEKVDSKYKKMILVKISSLKNMLFKRRIDRGVKNIFSRTRSFLFYIFFRIKSIFTYWSVLKKKNIKLHLGCGDAYLNGYINIDFPDKFHTIQRKLKKVDIYGDFTRLKFKEGSICEIELHHVFEHFEYYQTLELLKKWNSELEIGGKLIIETPDFKNSIISLLKESQIDGQFVHLRHVFGSQEAIWAKHLDGWYKEKFEYILPKFGYKVKEIGLMECKKLRNITVNAEKVRTISEEEFIEAKRFILGKYLVDHSDSERKLLKLWEDKKL